jgi:hypothetical protein
MGFEGREALGGELIGSVGVRHASPKCQRKPPQDGRFCRRPRLQRAGFPPRVGQAASSRASAPASRPTNVIAAKAAIHARHHEPMRSDLGPGLRRDDVIGK